MRQLDRMNKSYSRKVTRFFTGTELEDYLPDMIGNYSDEMDSLRRYQQESIAILNDGGVPSARRASYIAYTNALYSAFIKLGLAGDAAIAEGKAIEDYFTALYMWAVGEVSIADKISLDVYGVPLTHP